MKYLWFFVFIFAGCGDAGSVDEPGECVDAGADLPDAEITSQFKDSGN